MVNVCVCGGCSNSNHTGHRVHHFPRMNHPTFRAWVRFVQVKRQDFTARSVTANSTVCCAHFNESDYNVVDYNKSNNGYLNSSITNYSFAALDPKKALKHPTEVAIGPKMFCIGLYIIKQ